MGWIESPPMQGDLKHERTGITDHWGEGGAIQ